MTEREAIRILDPETTKEALFGTSREEGIKLVEEACKVAVKAMGKQKAKEALFEASLLKPAQCPSCKRVIGFGVNFCWNCGQAISWRKEYK